MTCMATIALVLECFGLACILTFMGAAAYDAVKDLVAGGW